MPASASSTQGSKHPSDLYLAGIIKDALPEARLLLFAGLDPTEGGNLEVQLGSTIADRVARFSGHDLGPLSEKAFERVVTIIEHAYGLGIAVGLHLDLPAFEKGLAKGGGR
jgi:hypothetical protein